MGFRYRANNQRKGKQMAGTQPGQGQLRYETQLKDVRETTLEGPHDRHYVDERGIGGTHFEGWRSAKDNAVIALYVQGKVTVAQAVAANARPKDHILALDNCANDKAFFALSQELVKNGVDIVKLEATRNRILGRLGHKVDMDKLGVVKDRTTIAQAQVQAELNEQSKRMQSMPVVIRNGQVKRVEIKAKPLTQRDIELAQAMVLANKREAMQKQLAKLQAEKAKLGVTVTDSLAAEILARHQKKVIVIK
jgi:DNA-binding protein YbaB